MSDFPDFSGYSDDPTNNVGVNASAPDFSGYSDDPTNNVGSNANNSPPDDSRADTGSFADAQYGSDFQSPAERQQDDSSWDVTGDVGSNKHQASPDYSGMDNAPDPTNNVGANADSGSFADAQSGADLQTPAERQQSDAGDVTSTVGANAQPTADSDNPDVGGGASQPGAYIQDTYNPPDQKQGGGNWWDKVKSTVSDVGAAIKDSIDPNQEGWLPNLTPVDSSPQNDIFSGTNLKADAASAAEGLGTVAGYGTDVYNRAVAEGGIAANDLIRNGDANAIPDALGNIPYDITGQKLPWQSNTDFQTAQFLANGGNGLSTILPGNAGGGDAGIYDVPLVGGVARLAGGAAATASGLWRGPDSDAMNPAIDTEQLQQDIASGQYSDQQLQQKYPGNEAYRVIQEVLNPINFIEPEIAGVKLAEIVDHLITAPTARAIDTLRASTLANGWTPETTAAADAILGSRGTLANRGIMDTAAPDAARALTDMRIDALPGMTNVSTATDTIAGLYRGADALAQGSVADAQQLAADLSLHMTGTDAAASNYLDAMQTIQRGDAVNRLTNAPGATGRDLTAQLAKGTAETSADVTARAAAAFPDRLRTIADNLTEGTPAVSQRDLVQVAEKRGINLGSATPEEMGWVRAEAARQTLASDVRAAMYNKAGAALPGTESALHKGLAGTANAVRGLLLMAGAPPLAIQKFSDEWIRALTQGVVSVRPQDLATLQAASRFGAGRNLFGQGDRFQGFLDNGTVRSAAIRNDVLPPAALSPRTARAPYGIGDTFATTNRYGEAMTPGSRIAAVAGAPFRGIAKFNDALIGAPTQHVLLNAFYHDTKTLDRTRAAIAEQAYQDVLALTHDPEEAALARDRLATATTQRDFVRVGRDIQRTTGVPVETAPAAPSFTGQSRYTPSARVTEAMSATGGEHGLVGAAGTPVRPGGAADKMPLPREIAPEKYGRNLGSAGAGMGQPLRGGDIAAGDGGAGYLSRQMRGNLPTNDPNAAGGFGTGRTLDRYGSPKGAPRTAAQAANDAAALAERNRMDAHLTETGSLESYYDELRASGDPRRVAAAGSAVHIEDAGAQRALAAAQTPADVARISHDLAEFDRAAREIRAIRQGMDPSYISKSPVRETFGPDTVTPRVMTPAERLVQVFGDRKIEPSAPRQIGSDARFTPTQPEEQVLGRAAQAAQGDVTAQVGARAQGDVTAAVGANGGFRPVERGTFTPTERATIPLAAPRDMQAIDAAYNRAGDAVTARGAELARAQREAVAAGTQRGYRIIGNQGDQTTLGGWLKNGVGGVTPPVLPFAPFHIHSAQFWARTFANHPAFAIAAAHALGNLDDYGTLNLPNGMTVDGLIKLLTGLHVIDWAQKAYGYDQAVAQQGRNNPLQRFAKDVAYNTVGENAFVRPFEYVGDPLNSLVQQHTNPLLTGKTDFATGLPAVDRRDQYKTSGAEGGLTGIAQTINDRFGQPVRRGVISDVTNPGQAIGNALREGVANLPGSVDLKEYDPASQMPYKAQELMGTLGWDKARFRGAEADAMTGSPRTPDGIALQDAYQRLMDRTAIGKIAPVQVNGPEGAPVYPPTSHTPTETAAYYRSLDYQQRAGEGGKDAGTGIPAGSYINQSGKNAGEPNSYYVESPEQARYATARADIAKGTLVTPESVPFMDYNRQYLQNPDIAAMGSAKEQASLPGSIAGNVSRTGAGLPQDQRIAQIAKEEVLQQQVGTNPDGTPFTLSNLLDQSGVTGPNGIEAKLHGMPAGPEKTALEGQLAAIKAELARTSPAAAAYLGQQDAAFTASSPSGQFYAGLPQPQKDAYDAFNDLRNSADYKRYDALIAAENAAGPFGSPAEKAWYTANKDELNRLKGVIGAAEQSIVTRFGVNPRELANQAAIAAGRPAPYANTALTAPSGTTTSASSARTSTYTPSSKKPFVPYTAAEKAAYGRSLGSSSSSRTASSGSSGASSAGNDFFDFYRGLTDKAEKAAVLSALDKANVNPIGQKGVTAQTFSQALTVAKDALYTKRAEAAMNGTRLAAGQGMTRAQAEYAIGQLERQAGIRSSAPVSAPALAPAPASAPKRTTTYAYPGKKKVA